MLMVHEVKMPVLSQSMIQGRIVEWLMKEGDKVDKGVVLVVVESDKATHELEAPVEGVLQKILVYEGAEVDVDTPIAIIECADEPGIIPDQSIIKQPSGAAVSAAPLIVQPGLARRKPVTPVAKRIAKDLGIDVNLVTGSGENGMVTEKDIRQYADQFKQSPLAKTDDDQVIPLTGQRGRIAEHMALSRRTAADVTTVMDVDMHRIASLHTKTQLSYTAYVAWAATQAMKEFPVLNAWLLDDHILVKHSIDLGIAVAIEGALVVPVLRNAHLKNVGEIDEEINTLGKKARAGQLTPDDMKGSTFTVTNSGVFGSLLFTPIINLPEVAILGMGKVADAPVVREGQVVASKVMYLCLTYDHRAVDGAMAVQFLQALKQILENVEP
jgi:pyruvate/2-oxoglutarate dehydrogenase complex dihydrolipoamide acyltransferase (E2) component